MDCLLVIDTCFWSMRGREFRVAQRRWQGTGRRGAGRVVRESHAESRHVHQLTFSSLDMLLCSSSFPCYQLYLISATWKSIVILKWGFRYSESMAVLTPSTHSASGPSQSESCGRNLEFGPEQLLLLWPPEFPKSTKLLHSSTILFIISVFSSSTLVLASSSHPLSSLPAHSTQ